MRLVGLLSFCKRITSIEKILALLLLVIVISLCILPIAVVGHTTNNDGNYQLLGQSRLLMKSLTNNPGAKDKGERCLSQSCFETAKTVKQYLDSTADPCNDFYQFSCGGWMSRNKVPPTRARWDSFSILSQILDERVRDLLTENETCKDPKIVNAAKKAYVACIDEDTLEKVGLRPLANLLQEYGGWRISMDTRSSSTFDFQKMLADMIRRFGIAPLIDVSVALDDKNTNRSLVNIDQPELEMPRSILLDPETYDKEHRAYRNWIQLVAKEMKGFLHSSVGDELIEEEAEAIHNFGVEVGNISTKQEDRRDANRMYNAMTLRDLQKLTDRSSSSNTKINWISFLNNIFQGTGTTFQGEDVVIVREVEYLIQLFKLLGRIPIDVIANYLHWRLVMEVGRETTQKLRELEFHFEQVTTGTKEQVPRWQECANLINLNLGFAVSYKYVQKHFDEEAKKSAETVAADIQGAFRQLLRENEWMDEDTKAKAQEKADAIVRLIGYPDWFRNQSAVDDYYEKITFGKSHFQNIEKMIRINILINLKDLHKPTDRSRWTVRPTIVNAYYSSQENRIMFPAGILQPPFFTKGSVSALNYGSLGAVIGHEITHGFDDEGRQFGKLGDLIQWWSNDTLQSYLEKAKCFIDQYSTFRVPEIDSLMKKEAKLNGFNTQGENIADNGGVREAFKAYSQYVETNGPELMLPDLPYTPEQLFFLGYAAVFCSMATPQALLNDILSDVHSPGKFRILGSVSNSEGFARAWNCPVGSRMNPVRKCVLW